MALINCTECGNEISDKALACPKCGNPSNNFSQTKEQKTQTTNTIHTENTSQFNQHKGAEVVYYSDNNGVKVTSTRFIVGSSTFPLQGITSIRSIIIPVSKTSSVVLFIVGLIMFFAGFINGAGILVCGFILCALAVYWYNKIKDDYGVQITTSAAESKPLISKNQDYIENVTRALNEAIIHRG